jgi:hypothetical protein
MAESIWHSKFAGAQDISGLMQYEVLKRGEGKVRSAGFEPR